MKCLYRVQHFSHNILMVFMVKVITSYTIAPVSHSGYTKHMEYKILSAPAWLSSTIKLNYIFN